VKTGAVILPHQLHADNPLLAMASDAYLIEHPHFFTHQKFHKKKLMFHRASMKAYERYLRGRNMRVEYIEALSCRDLPSLLGRFKKRGLKKLCFLDPVERKLISEIESLKAAADIEVQVLETPQFLTDRQTVQNILGSGQRYHMAGFYTKQRKRLGILLDNGKPVGGKWSFDVQNRRQLPKEIRLPEIPDYARGECYRDAKRYLEAHFADNPGTVDGWFFPTTRQEAQAFLADFLESRLPAFGPYEDAISKDQAVLFHSVLSPLLNIGLLEPEEVVDKVIEHSQDREIDIASVEGFVRQIIGWREFIRGVYLAIGEQQRDGNFWDLKNPLPQAFYDGSIGIEPVDTVIKRVLQNAYAHHIERLMILGNFMLLCEIRPDEVYRWFMELFVDAYDWVMVPNVYGMSQYADGGRITTKPYISSSNYVCKMSDFPRGSWCRVWDGLFWRFIDKYKDVFAANPRMRMMAVQADRMDPDRLADHIAEAERFLAGLFK